MCGIAGWIDLKADLSNRRDIIENMTGKLKHRGPDEEGFWLSENSLIGHRRLTVIDPVGGKQPMVRRHENNTYVITYNGELYNTEDLKKILKSRGYSFEGHSDTEVLLTSYIEWGSNCVEHLNGIFAFGIWNQDKGSIFLARDRFGVKPLFYSFKEDSLVFGSEIKAILAHPDIRAQIDCEGLAEIFSLCPSRTPGHGVFKDINELKPAHCLILNREGIFIKKYWALTSHEHTDSLEQTVKNTKSLVLDAIQRQLVSDVPLCTFLSGGLDSSAITAISSNFFKENDRGQLHTFSIDYTDNDKHFKPSNFQPDSDAPWIGRMSEKFDTKHHYVEFDTPQLAGSLKDAVLARDLPGMADVDSSLLLFCNEVKKHHTVSLSGECADEVFGGYPWYHRPELLNCGTFPWARSLSERTNILSGDLINVIEPENYIKKRYVETINEVPILPGENYEEIKRREMFYLNLYWFMATLLDRKDRMSMYCGLEVRVPFCDHRLVQYIWNIPWSMKMLDGKEKGLLRHALRGILPVDIVSRKKSPYPKTHNPSYEQAVSKQLMEILSSKNSPLLPLVNAKKLIKMVKRKSDYGKPWFGQLMAQPQLFAFLIQVHIWLKEYNVKIL